MFHPDTAHADDLACLTKDVDSRHTLSVASVDLSLCGLHCLAASIDEDPALCRLVGAVDRPFARLLGRKSHRQGPVSQGNPTNNLPLNEIERLFEECSSARRRDQLFAEGA